MKFAVAFEVCGEIEAESFEAARLLAHGMCGSFMRAAERQMLERATVDVASVDGDEDEEDATCDT